MKTIAALWDDYARDGIPLGTTRDQRAALRVAFYRGIGMLLEEHARAHRAAYPTLAAADYLTAASREVLRFAAVAAAEET